MKESMSNNLTSENITSLSFTSSDDKEVEHLNVIAIVASVFVLCLFVFLILFFMLKKNKKEEKVENMTYNEIYIRNSISDFKTDKSSDIKINEIYNSFDTQASSGKNKALANREEYVKSGIYFTIEEASKDTKSLASQTKKAENKPTKSDSTTLENSSQQNKSPVYAVVKKMNKKI